MREYLVRFQNGRNVVVRADNEFEARKIAYHRINYSSRPMSATATSVSEPTKRKASVRIKYNKILGGWYVVTGAHDTPLNGRFDSREDAQAWVDRRRA